MSATKIEGRIFNIPAGTAFARRFAAQLIAETKAAPHSLAAYRIILPTRRAARVLRHAFVQEGDQSLLLPRLHALGDIDEEELSLSMAGGPDLLEIPAALPKHKRQALLAKTIMAIPGYANSFDQALLLASALGSLMDQVYTEGLDLQKLPSLVPEEKLSAHWQVTLKFMEILSRVWPEVLRENGVIDAADRRTRLLRAMAAHWTKAPPQTPVIAAGTTGSIPAVADLLKVIAALPQGRIVLPGLDQDMDEESWQQLGESHPQYGLRLLLEGDAKKDTKGLGITRKQVHLWPACKPEEALDRRLLAAEIMRPSATTDEWTRRLPLDKMLQQKIKKATQNLRLIPCSNEREEAAAIAVLLRETLSHPDRTAALITPRRSLARRVTAACRRWDIALDDSAGQPLGQTLPGSFLSLSLQACTDDLSPVSLLALLKHPLSLADNVQALDKALRGLKPAPGLAGLKARDSGEITRVIGPILERFTAGSPPGKPRKFSEILAAHLKLAEDLATSARLWHGPEGEEAARFLATLQEQAGEFPEMDLPTYALVFAELLRGETVRPPYGTHPRLHILGLPEARMMDADLVILAGLNEGSWPPDHGFDPWMSRPMQKDFGLPGAERKIGLTAHDFVQGFCAGNVVLTRSLRQDGAPAVPARWLQRLSAVLEAAGLSEDDITDTAAAKWASQLDETGTPTPLKRPEPRPPVAARPRQLSVTNIEKWQKDPYSIYARYVLRLRKLKELEQPVDDAEKGNVLHKIMKRFIDEAGHPLPVDAQKTLQQIAAEQLASRNDDLAVWGFWQRRFEKTAAWLVQHETAWRERGARPAAQETGGQTALDGPQGPFTLTAEADRIDTIPGGAAIIDYKSGGSFYKSLLESGKLPQLPLEGLILANGGFAATGKLKPLSLQYWKLTGALKAGDKPVTADNDVAAIIERAEAGLKALIEAFDNEATPYYSLPRPEDAPRFNDYKHLARISEWTALGDDEEEAA